jgi:exopolysaccharide biosynthesis protein
MKQMSNEMEHVNHTAKKLKLTVTEDSVITTIQRMKNDTNMLVKYCETNNLPADAKKDVLQISLQLNMLCQN